MLLARVGTGLMAGLFLLTLSACPKDPYDADTWIDKLESDDPKEVEKAVNQLADVIKDPKAIKPLGKLWRKTSKSSRILRVIIGLADQPKEKGGPYWTDAVPILIEALEFEMGDQRSIEDAVAASDALGRAKDPNAVQPLIAAVNKTHAGKPLPITDAGQMVRIAAMRALGNFGNDPRAVETLVKVLGTDPLDDENRDNPEAQRAAGFLRGAAANALGATQNPAALEPLVMALFQIDMIFPQVRGALTRFGSPAVPELVKVLKGDHAAVNKFAKENNFANDCSTKGEGPGTTCIAPGALVYKSAMVLGDLRAKSAVPALVDQLKKPAKTSFFSPTGIPGSPDHTGVLDALRKIGEESATPAVLSVMKDEKTDDVFVRPQAIDVYSMMTRSTDGLDWLATQIKNDEQEEGIRKSAGLAYARLARRKDDLAPLDFMIDRYAKEAKKNIAKAASSKKEEDKEAAESSAAGYRDLSTLFWQHKVRALVGVQCGDDVNCYLKWLSATPDQTATELKIPVPLKIQKDDPDTLGKDLKEAFNIAAQERALLEIAKMGQKGAPALPTLLKLANSDDRLIREGVLLAMVRVAPTPCPDCKQRLDDVIKEQESQQRLDDLTRDTRVVRDYFAGVATAPPPQK